MNARMLYARVLLVRMQTFRLFGREECKQQPEDSELSRKFLLEDRDLTRCRASREVRFRIVLAVDPPGVQPLQ